MFTIYGLNIDQYYPFLKYLSSEHDVDVYVDTQAYHDNGKKKIYLQIEPFAIYDIRDHLVRNKSRYDAIVCHDGSFVEEKGVSYCPAATWIDPGYYKSVDLSKKRFQISHMAGYKYSTKGHTLRKDIYMRQKELVGVPLTCYRSWVAPQLPSLNDNPFIPEVSTTCTDHSGLSRTAKVVLFTEYQFSIIVENTKESNYFSEKLIDCLLMKTIPIYWGCPTVSKWFDTTGWICIESNTIEEVMLELQSRVATLDHSHYARFASAVEDNYRRALQLCDMGKNIARGFSSIPFLRVATDADGRI